MGAKSTIDISRDEALGKIYDMLDKASDRAIADVLEVLNDDCDTDSEDWLGVHNFCLK